jgi:hypothetical protein
MDLEYLSDDGWDSAEKIESLDLRVYALQVKELKLVEKALELSGVGNGP